MICELFTEGTPPFDFSQLLAYRNGEYSPWKVLEKIDDNYIRVGQEMYGIVVTGQGQIHNQVKANY